MSKSQYVANEAVVGVLTLTNRAGRDIYLHGEGNQGWLDFQIKNQRGVPLSPIHGAVTFGAVNVPAGRSVKKTVAISNYYRVSEQGHYGGFASIRMPGGTGTIYSSNRIHFDVTKARVIYKQRVGVPGSKTVREYHLMTYSNAGKSVLYVEVEDVRTGRAVQTYSLGEALMFRKPQATVSGKNNLHVLYLNDPTIFTHVRVDPNGKFLGRAFYKRGAVGTPRLETFANGEVKVAGGIYYDPKQEQANRAKVRRLSERPPFAFR